MNLSLPEPILIPRKRAVKRDFGVHGYFTKQSWDIVQKHILNFTAPNDIVLDPFGGSGVTFTEALITKRRAIHIDLNPLSVFWVNALFTQVNDDELAHAIEAILKQFEKQRPKNDEEVQDILKTIALPKNIEIKAKGADVGFLYELFTDKQIAELALLKSLIKKQKKNISECLMLSFSSTITKINKTFHYTKSDGGGDCAAFRYYRFRLAKTLTELDIVKVFKHKYTKLLSAKREIKQYLENDLLVKSKILKDDATKLPLENESVDYIYTDPPYGNKIPYLDLSAMWNAWLDFDITDDDYKKEAIEGGSLDKTSDEYQAIIKDSIEEMFRVLKWNRWMSFVFQHQNPKYWHLIVDTAEKVGFEYAGCVRYSNGQTSFKKRQHPFSVLSGQLIIYFRKRKNPQALLKHDLGSDIAGIIINNIEALIAKEHGATLEEIYNELIVHGLELGFLDILSKEYADLTPLLNEHFDYNLETEKYHIKKNTKFKSHIPLELRILYLFEIIFTKKK